MDNDKIVCVLIVKDDRAKVVKVLNGSEVVELCNFYGENINKNNTIHAFIFPAEVDISTLTNEDGYITSEFIEAYLRTKIDDVYMKALKELIYSLPESEKGKLIH